MLEDASSIDLNLPRTVGPYTLESVLGRGGMGVVYAARDTRLDRPVAVKMIQNIGDEVAVRRFWREARAAAAVSHPNVCQVFDVSEGADGLYLAMELLDGETLERRLKKGVLSPRAAVKVTLELLGALEVLHDNGFIHRDIKPSNVFITPHGAKLLDFGLSRPGVGTSALADAHESGVTMPGIVVGTPRYMSPEQLTADPLDGRSDLYSVAVLLFEMLSGRPPFTCSSFYDLVNAILKEHPPALSGPPDVVAIDHVIRRALAKDPRSRYATAAAMRQELEVITLSDSAEAAVPVRALVRLIVLPFRLPQPDESIAFLSHSLADAVSVQLALLGDVVVRSTVLGARFATDGADFRELSVAADVDLVISGNLLSSGERLRASIQLVDARSGTVVGATSVQSAVSDIFMLEDNIVSAVTQLLAPHRIASEGTTLRRDVPANPAAFESFLRAMELARSLDGLTSARGYFQRAVDEDPTFAPAWAGLGRCLRVAAKYEGEVDALPRAEESFRRALALNPQLSMAHHYLTHLESENGRADAAISRLLDRVRTSRTDPQLFAGLVHACRYAGLVEESLAAHREGARLDPTLRSSVEYTLLHLADDEGIDAIMSTPNPPGDPLAHVLSLLMRGRREEGLAGVKRLEGGNFPGTYRQSIAMARELLESGPIGDQHVATARKYRDPEALFIYSMMFASFGEAERAMDLLRDGVNLGYAPVIAMERHRAFAEVRQLADFPGVLEVARTRMRTARAVYDRGGGAELFGPTVNARISE
jgi:serine/threonine protein kinase